MEYENYFNNCVQNIDVCVKEASPRDVSFTHPKHMCDQNKMIMII